MIVLLLALAQQPAAATVGDTIWLRRVDPVPAGHLVQAPDWAPTGDVELLGPPEIRIVGGTVTLRFPLVAWRPGEHRVEVPGPIFIASDGSQTQAAARGGTIRVRSVLPEVPPDSELAIQPEAAIVSRTVASPLPLLLFLAAALVLLLPLHLWWRRRGPPATAPRRDGAVPLNAAPVDSWSRAGEGRAVLSAATGILRHALAERCPEAHPGLDTAACLTVVRERCPALPSAEFAAILVRLDDARFAPGPEGSTERLFADATALARRLDGDEAT